MLWPDFQFAWPLLHTPDPALYPPPKGTISPWGLPLLNTVLLVSSSITLTIAHHALNKGHRGALKFWLGLTLGSGIYGATFFMLTGFHGAHVTIGALILLIMLIRIVRGHFNAEHQFGFQAATWYWHFVDVVWLGLFLFVYVL